MPRRHQRSLIPGPSFLAALALLLLEAGCSSDGGPEEGSAGTGGIVGPGAETSGGTRSSSPPGTGGVGEPLGSGGMGPAGSGGQALGGAPLALGGTGGAQSSGGTTGALGGAGGAQSPGGTPGALGGAGGAQSFGGTAGDVGGAGGTQPSGGTNAELGGAGGAPSSGGTTSSTGGGDPGGTGAGGAAGGFGGAMTGGTDAGGGPASGGYAGGGTGSSGGSGGGAGGSGGATGGTGGGGGSGLVTGCDGETSGLSATAIFYASPTGSASGDGTSFATAMDFETALAAVAPGEMILLEPGTYRIPYSSGVANTIELSKSGQPGAPIAVVAADCGRAVFDFSFPEQAWVQDSYGFFVTGDYWTFKGIDVTRAGYQGTYVTGQHNAFENCTFHDNRNTGLEINEGGAYTTVINCDAYRNYDPKKFGGMADGFAPKQTQGPGNVLVGCRAWENSDDGFDTFDSPEVVVIAESWAFRNGVDVWGYGGFDGNGNGFKLGGNAKVAHNRITNSVAFGNLVKGFDQNNNAGGLTILNCTGYANGTNFGLGNPLSSGERHYLRNNVSLGASDSIANADAQYNSWNGIGVSAADFVSLDLSQATVARRPDGTLPETSLFKLTPSSELVDAGVDVGLPYSGSAPDLGAFELGQ